MFVIILTVEASRCDGPARPVRACIVIYGSLSSPTTTRLRHNHVRFTNTCIIYTDLLRRRAYMHQALVLLRDRLILPHKTPAR